LGGDTDLRGRGGVGKSEKTKNKKNSYDNYCIAIFFHAIIIVKHGTAHLLCSLLYLYYNNIII